MMLQFGGDARAQIMQDLFALSQLDFKRRGFFVEFGAADGKTLSNSWLLEKRFAWTGILSEPARCWHDALRANRDCRIDTRCVWTATGESIPFTEADLFSTASRFVGADRWAGIRAKGGSYDVPTVSLNDLLVEHDAPAEIDYLSIDTEGSEFEILSRFDFARWRIKVITCEHNFTAIRGPLHDLLASKGYARKFTHLSQHDDWFVLGP